MSDPPEEKEDDLWSTDESGEIAHRVAPFISTALLQRGGTPEMEDEILNGLDLMAASAPWPHFADVITRRLRAENVFHLLPARVQDRLESDPVHLQRAPQDGRLDLTLTVRLTDVAAERLAAALSERWNWWHGRVVSWEDWNNGHRVRLRPGGLPGLQLGLELSPPKIAEEISPSGEHASKTTFSTRFSGMLDGEGTHEALEIRSGSLLLVTLRGARIRGPAALLPGGLAARLVSGAFKAGYTGIVGHLRTTPAG